MDNVWRESAAVVLYLTNKTYAEGTSTKDNTKRRILEKSESFTVQSGVLLHRGPKNTFARVVVDLVEQDRIVRDLHEGLVGGGHFGQSSTIKKVTERFWWKSVTNDVRNFVKGCPVCQRANPANKVPASSLHPVPVKGLFHRWGIDMIG